VILAKATESEGYLVIPEMARDLLPEALEEIGKWADVIVYRDKVLISVVGRNIVGFEGLGDKVISVSGKVHLANVSANMMSENFVIDKDRLQVTLESLHDYIFKINS